MGNWHSKAQSSDDDLETGMSNENHSAAEDKNFAASKVGESLHKLIQKYTFLGEFCDQGCINSSGI